MTLNLNTVKVKEKTRESLLAALTELGQMDADFSGDNGLCYLWAEVWEANGFKNSSEFERKCKELSSEEEMILKYDSNLEWLLDELKDIKSDKTLIETFVSRWINNDRYYHDYQLEVIYDETGTAEYIVLATMS